MTKRTMMKEKIRAVAAKHPQASREAVWQLLKSTHPDDHWPWSYVRQILKSIGR